jgi:hypothetical protein
VKDPCAELAEHRYPDSPRKNCVLRCRRVLDRHGYWLRAALGRNRPNNPVSRVSVALSTESQQSRRNPESLVPQRFSQHRRAFEGNLFEPGLLDRLGSPPRIRQSFANSPPRVRCDDHTREAGGVELKGLSSTLQTSTDQPGRDRTAIPCLTGLAAPCQKPCQGPCQKPSNCRSETTSADSRMPPRWLYEKEGNIENGNEIALY